MALSDYTSYDEIRAVLGVESEELSDDTLGLNIYENSLLQDLDEIDVGLTAEILAVRTMETELSDAQNRLLRNADLFAPHCVAFHLTTSLPMFAPKNIGDGKATLARFSDAPYRDTVRKVTTAYERYKTSLSAAYKALISSSLTTQVRQYSIVSGLSIDPVTGVEPV